MKITFKKALAVILTLTLLIAATISMASVYTLAEETSNTETSSEESSSTSAIVKDESVKRMVKQENYKIREWDGELKKLNYQNFQYTFGRNNGIIKAETTYVFSFEYYCEVGDNGTGIFGACAYARTNTSGAAWGGANKDMVYNEELGKNNVVFIKHIGRHRMEFEFTTYKGQTSFNVGLMTGVDGDAYYWDFKLVEKDGDGTNLLKHGNFYGDWQNYVDEKIFTNYGTHSPQSLDGLGSYSFIPFNHTIANLPYEMTIEEYEEQQNSSEDTSSEDASSEESSVPQTSSKPTTSTSSVEASSEESSSATISDDTSSDVSSEDVDDTDANTDDAPKNKVSVTLIVVLAVSLLAIAGLTVATIFVIKKVKF